MNLLLIQCDYNGIISKCVKQWIEIVRQKKDGTPPNTSSYYDQADTGCVDLVPLIEDVYKYINTVQSKIRELGDYYDFPNNAVAVISEKDINSARKILTDINSEMGSYIEISDVDISANVFEKLLNKSSICDRFRDYFTLITYDNIKQDILFEVLKQSIY